MMSTNKANTGSSPLQCNTHLKHKEGNPVGINIVDMNDTEVYSINVLLRLLKCQIELMLVEHKHVSPKLFSSGPYGVWYHTIEL